MLAEELAEANTRAALQARERDTRAVNRNLQQTPPALSNPSSSSSSASFSPLSTLPRTISMEDHQLRNIIDSIPTFSGESMHNVKEWLSIVVLKFDIIGYNQSQRRRFIPQYLSGAALQWHLTHRDRLVNWADYTKDLEQAFPRVLTTSRDMNLQLLKNRAQGSTESFTDYYTSVLTLCRQHTPEMPDLQIVDWLKVGMTFALFEKLQEEEFITPQSLLLRAQRVELDNAVLRARQPQPLHQTSSVASPPVSGSPLSGSLHSADMAWQFSARPPPLMSVAPPTTFSYLSYPSASSPSSSYYNPPPHPPVQSQRSARRQRRPDIICYTCGQPGHISPRCPSRPKD